MMPRFELIRDRLPSLYRPEEGDKSLLTLFLQAVASLLEEVDREAGEVMQSHWYDFADRALYSPYVIRSLQLQDPSQPYPKPDDPVLKDFPYIHDLARLAALLSLPPWQNPPEVRELVEAYAQRIREIVRLYENGLGTLDALRSMIEAQLPVNLDAPYELQKRPFWLEELAPFFREILSVQARGEPLDEIGPLMRWAVTNNGLAAVPPTIYIQGLTPQADLVSATENPLIEIYQVGNGYPRLGLAYKNTVAPNSTLRLRPGFASWLGQDNGVQSAQALPSEKIPADPTAPGPWQAVTGVNTPTGVVAAIYQSHDRILWVVTNSGGTGTLWRYDGQSWSQALTGLAQLHCLAENNQSLPDNEQELLIGTDSGLLHMSLYPQSGSPFSATAAQGLQGQAVYTIFQADGFRLLGTADGVDTQSDDAAPDYDLHPFGLKGTKVYAINTDQTDTLYFGTDLGLFQYQSGTKNWYWYATKQDAGQGVDQQQFLLVDGADKNNFPTDVQVFLPPVKCIQRGPDMSLWLGTDKGIARYVAHSIDNNPKETVRSLSLIESSLRGFTFEAVLEAFPDLTTGPVFAIRQDERGLVWFCTERGLFRYDGRDWWQHQSGVWALLGQAESLYNDPAQPTKRGPWRYDRTSSKWQHIESDSSNWVDFTLAPRSTAEAAVYSVTWADQVVADLGQWDGTNFTSDKKYPMVDGGLIAHWRLDEGQGQVASDSSGNHNDGQLGSFSIGGTLPTWIGASESRFTGLHFDGQNFVKIENNPTLEPPSNTVEAWVRSSRPGTDGYILAKGAVNCHAASYALYTGSTGGIFFYVQNSDSTFFTSADGGTAVWDGNWHHVAGTFDGSTIRLYIDGIQVGTGITPPPPIIINYNLPIKELYIAAYQGSCQLGFIGDIAEVRVWNRALSPNEILSQAKEVRISDLVVHYKPSEQRIVTGGIPAMPRLPAGSSTWRYLSLERQGLVESADRPAWTIEGRLLPPPDLTAPDSGRYDLQTPTPPSDFDETIFAYNPAARVWFEWQTSQPLQIVVRLKKLSASEQIDPVILDRVRQGIQQVRPAGARVMLAVEEDIVRGE